MGFYGAEFSLYTVHLIVKTHPVSKTSLLHRELDLWKHSKGMSLNTVTHHCPVF